MPPVQTRASYQWTVSTNVCLNCHVIIVILYCAGTDFNQNICASFHIITICFSKVWLISMSQCILLYEIRHHTLTTWYQYWLFSLLFVYTAASLFTTAAKISNDDYISMVKLLWYTLCGLSIGRRFTGLHPAMKWLQCVIMLSIHCWISTCHCELGLVISMTNRG